MTCAMSSGDPTPTPVDLAAIRADRGTPIDLDVKGITLHHVADSGGYCQECRVQRNIRIVWPCQKARIAAAYAAQAERLAQVERENGRLAVSLAEARQAAEQARMRMDGTYVPKEDLDAAWSDLAQTEAECGALRDAAQKAAGHLWNGHVLKNHERHTDDAGCLGYDCEAVTGLRAALAPGAGAALLARLETAEDAAQNLRQVVIDETNGRWRVEADLAAAVRRAERAAEEWPKLATLILEVFHLNSASRADHYGKPVSECESPMCQEYRVEIRRLAAALGLAGAEGESQP